MGPSGWMARNCITVEKLMIFQRTNVAYVMAKLKHSGHLVVDVTMQEKKLGPANTELLWGHGI